MFCLQTQQPHPFFFLYIHIVKLVFGYIIDHDKLVEVLSNSYLVDYTPSFTTVRLYVQSDLTGM